VSPPTTPHKGGLAPLTPNGVELRAGGMCVGRGGPPRTGLGIVGSALGEGESHVEAPVCVSGSAAI
jgi:hypothetical protein